ncbi:hypothetical protein ACQZV8_05305 [Magnetococcales bacterium HHB-1]
MSLKEANERLAAIQVVQDSERKAKMHDPDMDRTPEENWQLTLNALKQHSRNEDWSECLEILTYLSNQESNPQVFKARAHAAWLALKTEAAIDQVTAVLYKLLISLGNDHQAAGPIASLANYMLLHRTPDHPNRPLAESHVHQMMMHASQLGPGDQEGFERWVVQNQLDNPDYFIPIVMETLEALIGNDWWIDQQKVQKEMEDANAEKAAKTTPS